ncbi:RCC1-like G exchanging factor-like protein [Tigriopus californicus]|uniref:RCC1-like G exchanging factor-like protein n=1 Tax=Tigriopus californicus TaxID=6832 RepID=UPI0027DA6BCD|nr:RCC1-like G exchanging factor-like protein [Tigriopus californicus]
MLQTRFTKALCTRSMSIFRSRAEEEKLKRAKAKRRQPLYSVDPDDEKNLPIYEYGSATPTNRVYTWGMACYGALGVPNYVRKRLNNTRKSSDVMHYPNRCPLAEKRITTSIGCGHGFTVFGIKDPVHHLLGTGINTDGQIGYHAPRKDHPLEILIAPVPTTLAIPKGHNVKSIGCGRAHTIVLSSDNQVFSIGNNAYGQCGRPVLPNEDYFRNRVIHTVKGPWESADEDETIVDVVCGQDHTFFLSTRGQLFSCGWGADGQLGGGDYASQHTPTLIHGDLKGENVVKVASSADCVLALTDQGEVFGWGNSEYGQLASVTDEQQINTPHKLNTRGLGRIKDIAAGGTICLILNGK